MARQTSRESDKAFRAYLDFPSRPRCREPRRRLKYDYYFAYGSNLNMGQMEMRCPDSQPVTPYQLRGWELVFRNVADIRKKKGAMVDGGLWQISREDERHLDRYEGYPRLYRKVLVTDPEFGVIMIYVMNSGGISMPCESYYRTIEEGYEDFDLHKGSLYKAVRHAHGRARQHPKRGKGTSKESKRSRGSA